MQLSSRTAPLLNTHGLMTTLNENNTPTVIEINECTLKQSTHTCTYTYTVCDNFLLKSDILKRNSRVIYLNRTLLHLFVIKTSSTPD